MTLLHMPLDDYSRTTRAPERLLASIQSLPTLAMNGSNRLLSAFRHRRAMQRFTRFTDHQLRDIGLERDWDGSVSSSQQR